MQTLTITPPAGFEVDFNENSREIKFKKASKDIMDQIQSVEDAIDFLGKSDEDVIILQKLQQVFSDDSHPVNHQKAIVLTKAFNEGWVPDWDNTKQVKYYPWFEMGGSSGFRFFDCGYQRSFSHVGSRLCFKSDKLAEHAGKKFTDIYKQFMLIK
jgi:hypothetical protein